MRTKEEILSILSKNKPGLEKQYKLKSLALFGSYSRGDQREESDIDLLVEVDSSLGLRFVDLAESIESLLNIRVDIVSKGAIAPRYWKQIESELVYV